MIIRRVVGLIFVKFGIIWSFFNKYSCSKLCSTCSSEQLAPCYFLFLFVGIILIVSGASLILTSNIKNIKKVKKKI